MLCVRVPILFFRRAEQMLKNEKAIDKARSWFVDRGYAYFPIIKPVKLPFYHEVLELPDDIFPKKPRRINLKKLEEERRVKVPRSITLLGDLILLNEIPEGADESDVGVALREEFGVRAVFLKVREVSGQFRVAMWKRIAGFGSTLTVHKEWKYHYIVNVSKAFFNPRMGNERLRVISQVKPEESVLDMFAGVGPFSIPISKVAKETIAVDINKAAIAYMTLNNIMNSGKTTIIWGDSSRVVRSLGKKFDRIIMNFPEGSFRFLEHALDALKSGGVIHFYAFERGENHSEALENVISRLREFGPFEILYARASRDVAPHKYLVILDLKFTRNAT